MRVIMFRILLMVSSEATLCLSLMHPRLPSSFSIVPACAQGTIAFVAPPSHVFQPVTLIPSGIIGVPGLVAASSQSDAYAVNFVYENPIPVARLPRLRSFIVTIRSMMPLP